MDKTPIEHADLPGRWDVVETPIPTHYREICEGCDSVYEAVNLTVFLTKQAWHHQKCGKPRY